MINLFLAVLFFFLAVDLSHTVQLFFLIRMESALVDSIADLFHHRIVKIQIEGGMQIKDVGVTVDKTTSDLRDEILSFKKELEQFDITFEILAEKSPKHKDTRDRAIRIGYRVSDDGVIIEKVYEKKRLPIRDISRKFEITEKILKRSKVFILSTAVLFFKKYTNLIVWIKGVK